LTLNQPIKLTGDSETDFKRINGFC